MSIRQTAPAQVPLLDVEDGPLRAQDNPGFLLVDPAGRQAGAAALALSRGWRAGDGDGADSGRDAEPGDGEAFSRPRLCHGDGGALRERAARFLRVPPASGQRADGEPVPAGAGPPHPGGRPPQPDGSLPGQRAGRYRPKTRRRIPRQIPDEKFNELFAELGSNRDRALVAFWVSTGARASELLGATAADADPGQQLITVVRKGTRLLQQVPASPDAFVWLRLYQAQIQGLAPAGRDQPLWWTLRRPWRALTYDAARAMFARANAALGSNWSLHDLRHSAAYRLARDPAMPLTDVQWVLGHAHLSTTQQYLNPLTEDVIASVLAFHGRHREPGSGSPPPAPGYRPESLRVLFGEDAL